MRRALVVGGSGPSGPHLLHGLVDRGFDVAMFHTGRHELADNPDVEHIHGDPFSVDGISDALGDRTFDVAIATYGRVRHIAAHLAGKAAQFISVGGTPVYKGHVSPGALEPWGHAVGITEDHDRVPADGIAGETYGSAAIRRTEDVIFGLGEQGAFGASVFRYPSIYGPRNPHAWEWSVLKRILDGRSFICVPDGGLPIHSRLSSWNAAHSVLCAVDHPAEAAGHGFNCADNDQFMLRQWMEMTMRLAGGSLEFVSVPGDVPSPAWGTMVFHYSGSPHVIVDTTKIRERLGYTDAMPAAEGLAETVEWLLANHKTASLTVLDKFDYEAEDRFVAHWRSNLASLDTDHWRDWTMPLPQTATGKKTSS